VKLTSIKFSPFWSSLYSTKLKTYHNQLIFKLYGNQAQEVLWEDLTTADSRKKRFVNFRGRDCVKNRNKKRFGEKEVLHETIRKRLEVK
jgi:hypothetical protein